MKGLDMFLKKHSEEKGYKIKTGKFVLLASKLKQNQELDYLGKISELLLLYKVKSSQFSRKHHSKYQN